MISPGLSRIDADLSNEWLLQIGSMATVVGLGIAFYVSWDRIHFALQRVRWLDRIGPASLYPRGLALLRTTATRLTLTLQRGKLGFYLLSTAIGALLAAAFAHGSAGLLAGLRPVGGIPAGPLLACTVAALGALLALVARDTLQRLLGAGAVGIGSAVLFLFRGAPDLAFTQLAVETVFVVVAAVALRRYRPFPGPHTAVLPRLAVSAAFGLVIAVLLLAITSSPFDRTLSDYYLANAYAEAHGRNVVNVIIVDFRGLDTLGEISVVMFAALAAWPLLQRRSRTK